MANLHTPEWDQEQDHPPFRWKRARLGRQAGAEQLGASLYELPPGAASWPLHAHWANEELLIVVSGRPTLRTGSDERELEPGEVVSFRAGGEGAHRVENRSEEPARLLVVSTMNAPDVVQYPDSGKMRASSFPPGGVAPEGAVDVFSRPDDSIGYFDDEE